MDFSNDPVNADAIPSVELIEYNGLDQNYLTVELIATGLLWLIIGGGALILIFINPMSFPDWAILLLYGLLLSLVLLSFLMTIFGFRRKKYALREHDILYQSGLIWRNFTVLPFNRVQHAEVQQGPVERLFELSKLKIYTAGGSGSDLIISGLPLAKAQNIKHFILHQTIENEEE